MLDRDFFRAYRALPSPFWEYVVSRAWRMRRARVVFEGFEAPASPVVFATNSTWKYDFMPFRVELERRRIPTVTITKGKNYHARAQGFLLRRLGVVPIVSRGYLLLVDFVAVTGRRPTEAEYAALRRYVDTGEALGAGFDAITENARVLLGHAFDPAAGDYRSFVQGVYAAAMAETVRLCRDAVDAGAHVQIYPEGTVSSRLGPGRIGAVQLAHALGRPIVPAGISGIHTDTVTVRFGAPFVPALPADLVPFSPEHEAKHRAVLQRETDALMDRIDTLLDPACRRLAGFAPDGTTGTRRFL